MLENLYLVLDWLVEIRIFNTEDSLHCNGNLGLHLLLPHSLSSLSFTTLLPLSRTLLLPCSERRLAAPSRAFSPLFIPFHPFSPLSHPFAINHKFQDLSLEISPSVPTVQPATYSLLQSPAYKGIKS